MQYPDEQTQNGVSENHSQQLDHARLGVVSSELPGQCEQGWQVHRGVGAWVPAGGSAVGIGGRDR